MPHSTPAPTIVAGLAKSLRAHPPFAAMADGDVGRIVRAARIAYFAPGETILAPGAARPDHCYVIRQGNVTGERPGPQGEPHVLWELAAGEMFPLGALLGNRPVTSVYRASADTFCLTFPAATFDLLVERSPVFQDFCTRRLAHLLDLARAEMQSEYAAGVTEARGLGVPLSEIARGGPVTVGPETPLRGALELLEARRIGSLPVVDADRRPLGVFTRADVIGRVVLPGRALDTPIRDLMSAPAVTLPADATAGDAALVMAQRGLRHVVVLDADGRVAAVVSERDLFGMQRLSVRELSSSIRRADDVAALAHCAADIRALSLALVAQGVASRQLTRMIASLNDQLTARILDVTLPRFDLTGLALDWLGMGSEGRGEQTIATDQDNGIIFAANDAALAPDAVRERVLPFAQAVNEALDRCGYPLCKGGVMAMNRRWCLSLPEWRAAFFQWIDRGDPESLLAANIFFDFRSLWGTSAFAQALRADIAARARANPRFLKQMSDNALATRPPLSWRGEIAGDADAAGTESVDLKLHGSMPFTDAARIFALATGVTATNTVERLAQAGAVNGTPDGDTRAWIDAFEYVQMLRLRTQHRRYAGRLAPSDNPNLVPLDDLSDLDRRILKEAFRQIRKLQQRLEMDYHG